MTKGVVSQRTWRMKGRA